jgi:hypothetical protein
MTIERTNLDTSAVWMLHSEETLATEVGGDLNAEIAVMMLKQAEQKRERLDLARDTLESELSRQESRQVASLREQAAETRTAAETAGLAGILAASANGIGSVAQACGATSADMLPLNTAAQAVSSYGQIAGPAHSFHADTAHADSVASGQHAEEVKRALDDLKDEDQSARDLSRAALDMLGETNRTENSTYQAALFRA